MKAFKYSPNQVRYALTGLLLGSLGFSLSMNPEQNQNISRNELNWGTYSLSSAAKDLKAEQENRRKDEDEEDEKRKKQPAEKKPAAQAAKAKAEKKVKDARKAAENATAPTKPLTKEEVEEMVAQAIRDALKKQAAASTGEGQTPTTPAAAPATTSGETATGRGAPAGTTAAGSTGSAPVIKQDIILGLPSGNQQCHVEISSTTDGKSLAKVTKMTDASTCAKVGDHVINTPTSNLAGIAEGLIAKLSEGEGNAGNSPKQSIADKIKSLKEVYKQRAKAECSQKEMEYEEKLSCAQDLAVELSDTIANNPLLNETKEAKRLMNDFVKSHVVPRISEGMMAQTITYDQFGRPIENTDNIEKMNQANQAALSLLENLNPEVTDSSLVGQLARTRTLGYNAQIGYARNMYLEAQEDKKDPTRFQIGILKENIAKMNLYPSNLNWMLTKDTMDWNNALSSGDKSEFRGVVQGVLANPVAGVIGQLPSASLYGQVDSMKQDLAAQALLKVSLDGSLSMTASTNPSAIPGSTPATPGAITSGLPAALASARLAGQGNRTNGLDLTNVTATSRRPAPVPSTTVGQPATTNPAPATQPPTAQPRGRVSRTGSN